MGDTRKTTRKIRTDIPAQISLSSQHDAQKIYPGPQLDLFYQRLDYLPIKLGKTSTIYGVRKKELILERGLIFKGVESL